MKISRNSMKAVLPLLLVAAGAGCLLVSGQITIVQNFGSDLATSDLNVYELFVDLNDNSDYEEHKDKIKSLETIGFVVAITNLGNASARGEGYLSLSKIANVTPAGVRAAATRILYVDDPIAPGEKREITFEDSQGYIENFDKIEEAIKDGSIYFYGITDIGQEVMYENLKLIATVNFGL